MSSSNNKELFLCYLAGILSFFLSFFSLFGRLSVCLFVSHMDIILVCSSFYLFVCLAHFLFAYCPYYGQFVLVCPGSGLEEPWLCRIMWN